MDPVKDRKPVTRELVLCDPVYWCHTTSRPLHFGPDEAAVGKTGSGQRGPIGQKTQSWTLAGRYG